MTDAPLTASALDGVELCTEIRVCRVQSVGEVAERLLERVKARVQAVCDHECEEGANAPNSADAKPQVAHAVSPSQVGQKSSFSAHMKKCGDCQSAPDEMAPPQGIEPCSAVLETAASPLNASGINCARQEGDDPPGAKDTAREQPRLELVMS